MNRASQILILAVAFLLFTTAGTAVPSWWFDQCHDAKEGDWDSGGDVCGGGSVTLKQQDYVTFEWQEYPPGKENVYHNQRFDTRLSPDLTGRVTSIDVTLQYWDGEEFSSLDTVSVNSTGWVNTSDLLDSAATRDGAYVFRVSVPEQSIAGGNKVDVEATNMHINYTAAGSLSYSTANSDDSPVLGSSTIQTEDTTTVASTTVCSGGYCGRAESLLRANGSSISNVNGLSLASGDNPQTATLCDGSPDTGSCSTAEQDTAWKIKGVETGAYGIDVAASSDYAGNGVNEPVSTESVLTVEGGALSTSIKLETTEVLEETSFDVTADVTCDASGGCPAVSVAAEDGDGSALGTGTTPFATDGENPRSCGDMEDGGTCTKTWTVEASGDGTADYDIRVNASSSDTDISGSAASGTVTIEAPSVSISGVAAGGSSTALKAGFDYSANVEAAVTCTVNDGSSCSTTVGATGGSSASSSCTIATPGYQASNTLGCTIENTTYSVSDSSSGSFSIAGSLSGASTDTDTVQLGDAITVYCGVANDGAIDYDAGKDGKDYSSVRARITGPNGETATSASTDPTLALASGSGTSESETLTVPETGSGGEWTATCSEYQLIDSILMAAGPVETTFEVSTNTSSSTAEDLSVDFLAPNPRETYYTGQQIDVVVAVEDAGGDRVTGASVRVNGKQLRDDGGGADKEAGDGLYARSMTIPGTQESYRVTARAETANRSGSTSSILTVRDGFSISGVTVGEAYSIGETVTANGSIALRRDPRNTSVSIRFVSPSGTEATRTRRSITDGSFAASYTLRSGVSTGPWTVEVEASDTYDEDATSASFEVRPSNPGAFYLDFLAPERSTAQPGDTLPITVRPESSRTGNAISLQEATCSVAGVTTTLQPSGKLYEGSITIPMATRPGSYTVSCEGVRTYEGERKRSTNEISLSVESLPLTVEVIEPASGVLSTGTNVSVAVNVTREGRPATNTTVGVLIDGENTSIELQPSGKPGIYRGTVTVSERAESVRFRAQDAFQNTGESDTVAVTPPGEGFDTRLFALYAAIFFAASLAIYGIYRRYLYEPPLEKQEEELTRKLRSVEDSIQDTQRDYFNRKIDEESFRQMMEKYKEQKTQLQNELRQVRNELEREAS